MVNYKRVVCEAAVLTLLALLAVAGAAPCAHDAHYDQRQNGSENYRLNIDGVVIAVVPADSLLAAASDINLGDLLDLEDLSELQKPKPPASAAVLKPPAATADATESKPNDAEPEEPKPADSPLSDVSLASENKGQKKDASTWKQQKNNRLKNKIAQLLLPLLRRNRHH